MTGSWVTIMVIKNAVLITSFIYVKKDMMHIGT